MASIFCTEFILLKFVKRKERTLTKSFFLVRGMEKKKKAEKQDKFGFRRVDTTVTNLHIALVGCYYVVCSSEAK